MMAFIQKYYGVFFILFVLCIVVLSFYLGYEEGSKGRVLTSKGVIFSCPNTILEKQQISLSNATDTPTIEGSSVGTTDVVAQNGGAYMGSKNGTKYYTPDCPGSKRIKVENVIWFQSIEDATLQGYSKGSC